MFPCVCAVESMPHYTIYEILSPSRRYYTYGSVRGKCLLPSKCPGAYFSYVNGEESAYSQISTISVVNTQTSFAGQRVLASRDIFIGQKA